MPGLLQATDALSGFSADIDRVLAQAGSKSPTTTPSARTPVIFLGNGLSRNRRCAALLSNSHSTYTIVEDLFVIANAALQELPKYLQAEYHILLNCQKATEHVTAEVETMLQAISQKTSSSIQVYRQQSEWIDALSAAPILDALIVNQHITWHSRYEDPGPWYGLSRITTKHNAAVVFLEFLWMVGGKSKQEDIAWEERLLSVDSGTSNVMDEYTQWQPDQWKEREETYRVALPRLWMMCYPDILLMENERRTSVGLLW